VGSIDRRRFIVCGGTFLAAPAVCLAEQARQRVAILSLGTAVTSTALVRALSEGLRELAHVEGRDIEIDVRFAEGSEAALARLARELSARRPSVFVAPGTVVVDAVRKAAPGVPVVTVVGDMPGAGLATQLSRPEADITGVSFLSASLDAKRLEFLAPLLPKGSAVLNLEDSSARASSQAALGDTGRALGLVLHSIEARTVEEIDAAFMAARKLHVAGVNVLSSPFLNTHRARIFKLAAQARLPAIYQWPESAEEGGLLGYGPRLSTIYRQLAGYASRILRGAKAAQLPVEQPTRFELVVNLKTARALGIEIPQSVLLRADRAIE
jgi:putative ABC transport system substrate-binding protein